MSVPTHREGCSTRMWQTTCPDCGEDVFFFCCSCGSRIYFDSPGKPWPQHGDRCISYMIRVLRDVDGVPEQHIRSLVEEYSATTGVPIPPDAESILSHLGLDDRRRAYIANIAAGKEDAEVEGKIVHMNKQVNFFKRFGFPENNIGSGMLGKLVQKSYVELTLQQDEDPKTRAVNRFIFFAEQDLFAGSGTRLGGRVFVALKPFVVPCQPPIWCAELIQKSI
jgi:hypothetical protein